jgi:hypothetical protein
MHWLDVAIATGVLISKGKVYGWRVMICERLEMVFCRAPRILVKIGVEFVQRAFPATFFFPGVERQQNEIRYNRKQENRFFRSAPQVRRSCPQVRKSCCVRHSQTIQSDTRKLTHRFPLHYSHVA